MVLKINTFSSHYDSTYPDVLFMRWRRMDEKEKHTYVNGYISIQRKPWDKTRASFQMCESSDVRKMWCLFIVIICFYFTMTHILTASKSTIRLKGVLDQ